MPRWRRRAQTLRYPSPWNGLSARTRRICPTRSASVAAPSGPRSSARAVARAGRPPGPAGHPADQVEVVDLARRDRRLHRLSRRPEGQSRPATRTAAAHSRSSGTPVTSATRPGGHRPDRLCQLVEADGVAGDVIAVDLPRLDD